mmetsp:Transcript_4765/g.8466  ORF Transcript_4765/g.8466 Transcript_4765/m.8466 type:complete len:253 (+) Transcript_4765:1008-1766(+)
MKTTMASSLLKTSWHMRQRRSRTAKPHRQSLSQVPQLRRGKAKVIVKSTTHKTKSARRGDHQVQGETRPPERALPQLRALHDPSRRTPTRGPRPSSRARLRWPQQQAIINLLVKMGRKKLEASRLKRMLLLRPRLLPPPPPLPLLPPRRKSKKKEKKKKMNWQLHRRSRRKGAPRTTSLIVTKRQPLSRKRRALSRRLQVMSKLLNPLPLWMWTRNPHLCMRLGSTIWTLSGPLKLAQSETNDSQEQNLPAP